MSVQAVQAFNSEVIPNRGQVPDTDELFGTIERVGAASFCISDPSDQEIELNSSSTESEEEPDQDWLEETFFNRPNRRVHVEEEGEIDKETFIEERRMARLQRREALQRLREAEGQRDVEHLEEPVINEPNAEQQNGISIGEALGRLVGVVGTYFFQRTVNQWMEYGAIQVGRVIGPYLLGNATSTI